MSLSGDEPQQFFGPLIGRTTTFMLDGRPANLEFAAMVMSFVSQASTSCAVFDLDAFFSSNSDSVLSGMDATSARSSVIQVPEPGSGVELEFSRLFERGQEVVIIDSLNSLYHLLSLEDGASRSRKLAYALAALSYLARTCEKTVILSMYRREGFFQAGTHRSISALSDSTASVEANKGAVRIRTERGTLWPGGSFSSRIL